MLFLLVDMFCTYHFRLRSLLIFNKQLKEQDPIYERSDNTVHLYVVLHSIMPAVARPFTGCDYITGDLEAAIVAALITAHSTTHAPGAPCPSARIEKKSNDQQCVLQVQVRVNGHTFYQGGRTIQAPPK